MFNIAKVQKDLAALSDLVLLKELRDTDAALNQLHQKYNLLAGERDRRITENIQVAGDQPAKEVAIPQPPNKSPLEQKAEDEKAHADKVAAQAERDKAVKSL